MFEHEEITFNYVSAITTCLVIEIQSVFVSVTFPRDQHRLSRHLMRPSKFWKIIFEPNSTRIFRPIERSLDALIRRWSENRLRIFPVRQSRVHNAITSEFKTWRRLQCCEVEYDPNEKLFRVFRNTNLILRNLYVFSHQTELKTSLKVTVRIHVYCVMVLKHLKHFMNLPP